MITVFNFESRKQATSVGFALSFIQTEFYIMQMKSTMPPCLSVKVRLFLVGTHFLIYHCIYSIGLTKGLKVTNLKVSEGGPRLGLG